MTSHQDLAHAHGCLQISELSDHLGDAIGDPGLVGHVRELGSEFVYKTYNEPLSDGSHLETLIGFRRSLDSAERDYVDACFAWPLRRVCDGDLTIGFIMQRARSTFWIRIRGAPHLLELQYLYGDSHSKQLGIALPDQQARLRLTTKLAQAYSFLRLHNLVYGDLSDKNLLWSLSGGEQIFLIDCDNIAFAVGSKPPHGIAVSQMWRDPCRDEVDFETDAHGLGAFFWRTFYHIAKPLPNKAAELFVPDSYVASPGLEDLCYRALDCKLPRPAPSEWLPILADALSTESATSPPRPKRRSAEKKAVVRGLAAAAALAASIALLLSLTIGGGPGHHARPVQPITPAATHPPPTAAAAGVVPVHHLTGTKRLVPGRLRLRVLSYATQTVKAGTLVYVRLAVVDDSDDAIDLRSAPFRLVLLSTRRPTAAFRGSHVTKIVNDAHVYYAYHFQGGKLRPIPGVSAGGRFGWKAGIASPHSTTGSQSTAPSANLVAYRVPTKQAIGRRPSLASLGVVGVAWMTPDGRFLGFTHRTHWGGASVSRTFGRVR